jgi:hypothetical protein
MVVTRNLAVGVGPKSMVELKAQAKAKFYMYCFGLR